MNKLGGGILLRVVKLAASPPCHCHLAVGRAPQGPQRPDIYLGQGWAGQQGHTYFSEADNEHRQ